jgi:hypothetical protein
MPADWKDDVTPWGRPSVPRHTRLRLPVIGLESEFNVLLDEVEIDPRAFWKHPGAFIDRPLLPRERSSLQLPTGGAVYFDRGVIEVVTPVIEVAPGCTARAVRNLWEQIGFVREQLTGWQKRSGHTVRLKAYSTHYNISFELTRAEQNGSRNIKKLALLLAYVLPVPVMMAGANRRSTGVGVRPRDGNRIEVTVDFTPDPGLMIATATLIVGIVREIISWPSYELSLLDQLPIPVVAGVVPGKHTTRRGWLTKDFHYPQSPYTSDVDARIWTTPQGQKMSLRQMAFKTTWFFRRAIRRVSDPFSFRLLLAILEGRAPSMLELIDRPTAYEDVGRLCQWGMVIHELRNYDAELSLLRPKHDVWDRNSIDQHVAARARERNRIAEEMEEVGAERSAAQRKSAYEGKQRTADEKLIDAAADAEFAAEYSQSLLPPELAAGQIKKRADKSLLSRRHDDTPGKLVPKRGSEYMDRRTGQTRPATPTTRRKAERRKNAYAVPFPDRRLTRSAYEQVFLKLVSGGRLRLGKDLFTPVGMKGWYHAIFRRESDGRERLLTIDQLLKKMNDWQ